MQAPPGGHLVLDFKEPLDPPAGGSVTLSFTSSAPELAGVGGLYSTQFGGAAVGLQALRIAPSGWRDSAFPVWPLKTPTVEKAALRIYPAGWQDGRSSEPTYVRWRRFLTPLPITPSPNIPVPYSVRLAGGYQPAPGSNIILNFAEPLVPPPGGLMVLEFGASGYTRVLGATLGDTAATGTPYLLKPDQLRPSGIDSLAVMGTPKVEGDVRYVSLSVGIPPPDEQVGKPNLTKKATALLPAGIAANAFGVSVVFNWRQYLRPGGFVGLSTGTPFVIGGVKYVTPTGMVATAFGGAAVINTTANRSLLPVGIPAPGFGAPNVSPRTLFPVGIFGGLGTPLVQRNPAPLGFDLLAWGRPTVDYRTKYISPNGVAPVEPGYPRVFDPTQKVFPASLLQAGVFGDTKIVNVSLVVRAAGFESLEMSAWASLESNRRYVTAPGWHAAGFGSTEIRNKTPSLAPPGVDALRVPAPAIGYARRFIYFAGINSMVLGQVKVTKTPEIAPLGFAGALGVPTIWPRVRTVEAKGSDHALLPALTVWFRYRYIAQDGVATDGYGAVKIEHWRRQMLAAGAQHSAYGTPRVTNADRTIAPASIFENFATAHMVGGLRFLRPVGFDAARFGARIIPEVQRAYPQGFSGVFGLASIRNDNQLIAPAGFITVGQQPADRWGTARAFNSRQHVTMGYDPDSGLNPPAWPLWTLIENRTRVMRATGNVMSRVAEPFIFNNARLLSPAGIEAPAKAAEYKAGMVAYRIRSFRLEGVEAPYMSTWGRVYNDAAVIAPKGLVGTLFGTALLEKTRRYFDHIGGFDSAWFGYPMVADRIRTVAFEGRYTIGSPVIALPTVKLHTRYVDAIGTDMSGLGAASLSIHWTLITPRWTLQNLYGVPEVKNQTPELRMHGRASDEFGDAAVRLQWRPVEPVETFTQLMGRANIAFRDRSVTVGGLRAGAIGDKLVVTKTGAPPYSTQFVWLDVLIDEEGGQHLGNGIEPPESQVGKPIMNQQVLYVIQAQPNTLLGNPRVTANTIRVEPGYQELLVGEPMVSLAIRTMTAEGTNATIALGKPRLSPHTVYSTMEAPEQARLNHPVTGLHYVDAFNKPPGAILGYPVVTLRRRRLAVAGELFSRNGQPSVQNTRHYIAPPSWSSLRFGWHTIPGPQQVEQFDSSSTAVFGTATVERPPYVGPRTIQGIGLSSQGFTAPLVDFFNRAVKPAGFPAAMMGTMIAGDTPYQWQGLRVGPLMPTIPSGVNTAACGIPWISFRVRELQPQGFDAFVCEYDLTAFDKRMRVTRGAVTRPSRVITPVGIAAFVSATSDVRPGAHFIRPDGNADQFRKGAF